MILHNRLREPGTSRSSERKSRSRRCAFRPQLAGLEDRTLLTLVPTSTAIVASAATAFYGHGVTFTATVSSNLPGNGMPTGMVTFSDGGKILGTATLSNGSAAFTEPANALGLRTITASYSGDANFASSATGTVITVAGTGQAGHSGDYGQAANAQIQYPYGLAADAAGDVFIADTANDVVREVVRATGQIIPVAGNGQAGYSGDGGPATIAQLDAPYGVALDSAGNLFIADFENAVVREVVHASGRIFTVAGNHTYGYSGDNGPATKAQLFSPTGVAVNSAGDLFIADPEDNVVREVIKASAEIITVAGNGQAGYSGDGGPAPKAELDQPYGVALDAGGDLFISDSLNHVVREVVIPDDNIVTVAGNGQFGYSGNGGPATKGELKYPHGVALDSAGDLFIADTVNNVVREVVAGAGQIVTVAGNGAGGYGGDGGPATQAFFDSENGVALDTAGDLFIADSFNHRIRQVTAPARVLVQPDATTTSIESSATSAVVGQLVTFTANVVANSPGSGTPTGTVTFRDGAIAVGTAVLNGGTAKLSIPLTNLGARAITASYSGSADFAASSTGEITTVAGIGTQGYSGDYLLPIDAQLYTPGRVTVDSAGDLFIADTNNAVVREVFPASPEIVTIAGDGTFGYSGDGKSATKAQLTSPYGVAVDSSGNLFIADSGNEVVREVVAATQTIITFAGNGKRGYGGDQGPAAAAQLNHPLGVALDSAGNLFIADSGNNRIREVIKASGKIITVAGNGTSGYSGDGKSATKAQLGSPEGVAVDSSGNLFIADSGNEVVREVVAATQTIITFAGTGKAGDSGDNGPASQAQLNSPADVAVDLDGNLFIADYSNKIREVIRATGTIVSVAGTGQYGYGGDGGQATAAQLAAPFGVALDATGDLLIADTGNNRIRLATLPARVVVNPDATMTSLTASAGSTVFGQAVTFTAMVSAQGNSTLKPSGAVRFTIDGVPETVPLDGLGQARLTTAVLGPGSHTVIAAYAGSASLLSSQPATAQHAVVAAETQAVLVPVALRNGHRKVVGLKLTAWVDPVAPGAGVPTGTVTFFSNGRALGTAALSHGVAALTVKPKRVLKKAITIGYGGDVDFRPSAPVRVVLGSTALRTLARPMGAFLSRAQRGTPALVPSADIRRPLGELSFTRR
jgi:sugar lactone lactonase YvrE